MRHNQNARHMRNGGRRGGNGGQHGGGHHNNGGGGNSGHQHRRGGNPRVQTFDSNGPEVRIRGNAIQICEKYLTLARDTAASDRVLAESYLQHAEHYQRMINEMNEESSRHNPQYQHQQPFDNGGTAQPGVIDGSTPQPVVDGMADLDQGFLVKDTRQPAPAAAAAAEGEQPDTRRPHRHPREQEAV